MAREQWDIAWADMTVVGDDWVLSEHGQELLADGWEPYAVTLLSVYDQAQPEPQDLFRERHWFRRVVAV